jgi:hypothetical protein
MRGFAAACAIAALAAASSAASAQEDLPGRVGRVANLAGELFIAPQDRPDAWAPAALNYPVASGDNLWVGNDGRAEVDVGGTQLRLAGDTNIHVSRLDEREFALFVAQGRASIRVRVLEGGETARVDTPNAQVTITRPGLYRIDVSPDREHTHVVVREGEIEIQTANALQQVLPGQSADVDGPSPQYAAVQNGIGIDGFDSWVADRDRYYRVAATSYVSPQMVGAADLSQYGSWTQNQEYGAVWYPNDVSADWAPYRNGYWVDVGTWGPTWVDYAPWGYAPFHYGRWAYINGRWGWCPGSYVARPLWAPALVAWTGGAGWGVSVSVGGPVYGWVPLAWGEPYRPWWGRCSYGCWDRYNKPYAVNVAVWRPNGPPPSSYRNWNAPNGVTAVRGSSLYARQPVRQNMVRVSRDQVAAAPVLSSAPQVRESRASFQRPAGAPPPASSFQRADARPAPQSPGGAVTRDSRASPPGSTTRDSRASPAPTQVYQAPASRNISPATRAPSQATPSSPPVQRDDRRSQPVQAPSYAQPPSSRAAQSQVQPSQPPSSRAAQPQAQPSPPPSSRAAQPQVQPSPPPSSRAAQPQAQPSPQPSSRAAQPPPQGQMMRSPQPVQAQPQVQSPPPMRAQPPQMQPSPARAQPPMQPAPQVQPQMRQSRPAPVPQAAPPSPPQNAAPAARSAPNPGSPNQRGGSQGQDGGGGGNMQRTR